MCTRSGTRSRSVTAPAPLIDTYLAGFFLIGASTALSVAGLLVVRKVLHSRNLISSHDVGGYLLSVVGTIYAVIH